MIRPRIGRDGRMAGGRILGLIVSVSASAIAHSQGKASPITSPAMQSPTVAVAGSSGPAQIVDGSGRVFATAYDQAGHLISLNSTSGLNAHNLQISYRLDGRIARVLFGNQYAVYFRYDPLGRQEIGDRLGNTLIRTNSGPGSYVTQRTTDPQGVLTSTLKRLQSLFALFPSMQGLSSVSAGTNSAP